MWWNAQALVRGAEARFAAWSAGPKQPYVATAGDGSAQDGIAILTAALRTAQPRGLVWHEQAMPDERHMTIYPVAAPQALRLLFAAIGARRAAIPAARGQAAATGSSRRHTSLFADEP